VIKPGAGPCLRSRWDTIPLSIYTDASRRNIELLTSTPLKAPDIALANGYFQTGSS
jgi:hypothetical protein